MSVTEMRDLRAAQPEGGPMRTAVIQRIVPEIVGDSMLMTYRLLFLLGEKLDHLRTAAEPEPAPLRSTRCEDAPSLRLRSRGRSPRTGATR